MLFIQVDVLSWVSAKHNMGMAFDRQTWNQIKACALVSVCVVFMCLWIANFCLECFDTGRSVGNCV